MTVETLQAIVEWLGTKPGMTLGLIAWVFICTGVWRVYPSKQLIYVLVVPCLLSLLLLFGGSGATTVILGIDVAVGIVLLIDVFLLPTKNTFEAERRIVRSASIGMPIESTITLINRGRIQFSIWLKEDTPEDWDCEPEERYSKVRGQSRYTFAFELVPSRRGAFELECLHLRVSSRLGFWVRYFSIPLPATINVYPDMKQLQEYALLARTNRLTLLGVRRTRRIGQDNEFERLRDYTVDDNYKHIDWRSTARRNKLTVRDFQANQSQRIIFMVDCGRMMTNQVNSRSLLDHAFNSMLMLSYVALNEGDSVGLICFSDEIHTFIPPKGGKNQMNRLLHGAFDRFPQLVESRYDEAFMHLSSNCLKRSMVVLLTNVIDEVNTNQIESHLTRIVGRHLPLAILMRDHAMYDAVEEGRQNIFRAGAAATILSWRHQVLTNLQRKGVLMLDVFPEEMTAPLINQYLEIKARHLL